MIGLLMSMYIFLDIVMTGIHWPIGTNCCIYLFRNKLSYFHYLISAPIDATASIPLLLWQSHTAHKADNSKDTITVTPNSYLYKSSHTLACMGMFGRACICSAWGENCCQIPPAATYLPWKHHYRAAENQVPDPYLPRHHLLGMSWEATLYIRWSGGLASFITVTSTVPLY